MQWNDDDPSGLALREPDLILPEVHRTPAQRYQVAQSLPGERSGQNHETPKIVWCLAKKRFQFRQREGAASIGAVLVQLQARALGTGETDSI